MEAAFPTHSDEPVRDGSALEVRMEYSSRAANVARGIVVFGLRTRQAAKRTLFLFMRIALADTKYNHAFLVFSRRCAGKSLYVSFVIGRLAAPCDW